MKLRPANAEAREKTRRELERDEEVSHLSAKRLHEQQDVQDKLEAQPAYDRYIQALSKRSAYKKDSATAEARARSRILSEQKRKRKYNEDAAKGTLFRHAGFKRVIRLILQQEADTMSAPRHANGKKSIIHLAQDGSLRIGGTAMYVLMLLTQRMLIMMMEHAALFAIHRGAQTVKSKDISLALLMRQSVTQQSPIDIAD